MFTSLSNFIQTLSKDTHLPVDILKTIFIIILNIILSAFYTFLKKPFIRLLYSVVIGFIELIFLLQFQAVYFLISLITTFILINLLPKKSFLISIIISIISLLFVHLQRFLFDYNSWKVDCSVYIMILVTKLTYYGLAVQKNKTLSLNLFHYLSYCLFFPSLLAGPTFSYERFLQFIYLQQEYKHIKLSYKNILKPLGMGIIVSIITAIVLPIFDPAWVLNNQTYQSYSVVGKLASINIIGFFYRVKFYTAWYLIQTAINFSGLSFSENGENNAVTCGSIMFQIEPNPKNKTEYWNSSVQIWLKVVVYDNIAKLTKNTTTSVFGTFLVSAFWHGVYLTYYFGFIQWGILIHLTKWIYKMSFIFPEKFRSSPIATVLVYLVGCVSMNYIGMGIVLLQWNNMITFSSQLYYCITIGLVVVMGLSFVIKPPRKSKQNRDKSKKQTAKID